MRISTELNDFNEQLKSLKSYLGSYKGFNEEVYRIKMNKLLDLFIELNYEEKKVIFHTYFNLNKLKNNNIHGDLDNTLNELVKIEQHEYELNKNIKEEFDNIEKLNAVEMIKLKIFLVKFFSIALFSFLMLIMILVVIFNEVGLVKNLFNPMIEFFKVLGIVFKS